MRFGFGHKTPAALRCRLHHFFLLPSSIRAESPVLLEQRYFRIKRDPLFLSESLFVAFGRLVLISGRPATRPFAQLNQAIDAFQERG